MLQNVKHEPDENYILYGARITHYLHEANMSKGMTKEAFEHIKVDHYIRGLPSDLAHVIRRLNPKNLEEAADASRLHEAYTVKRKPKDIVQPKLMTMDYRSTGNNDS